MRILTLNTHSWLEEEPLQKLEQLAAVIVERDYDLIALQEVNQSMTAAPAVTDFFFQPGDLNGVSLLDDNFALQLANKLKELGQLYYWCWAPVHIGYDRFHEGLALFSKEPIQSVNQLVSRQADFTDYRTRRLLLGRTMAEGREITVVSCHYSWWAADLTTGFAYEWQQTLDWLAETKEPLLLLGDFNNPAERAEEGYAQVIKHFSDSYYLARKRDGEHTVLKEIDGWSENEQQLRIDFAFVDSRFEVEQYEVLFDGRKTPVVSDHFGIEVILNWKE